MAKTAEEMVAYLLAQRKTVEGHTCGLPAGSYWDGYYKGKLDMIDFQLCYYTDNWSKEFGGLTENTEKKETQA